MLVYRTKQVNSSVQEIPVEPMRIHLKRFYYLYELKRGMYHADMSDYYGSPEHPSRTSHSCHNMPSSHFKLRRDSDLPMALDLRHGRRDARQLAFFFLTLYRVSQGKSYPKVVQSTQ